MQQNDLNNESWLLAQSFYHGFLPRQDVLFILKKKGDYLVRISEKPNGNVVKREIVLCIAWPNANARSKEMDTKDIKCVLISRTRGYAIEKNKFFPKLEHLFDYYRQNAFRNETAGFLHLRRPMSTARWEFKHKDVRLIKKVGQGAYGEVYKGEVKRGKNFFMAAIKMMKPDGPDSAEKLKEVLAEARLTRSLNHPNIVRCRGIAVDEYPFYIVIDFMDGGSLDSYLRKNAETLSLETKNSMAINAAWGIEFMHSKHIIHRDIAARNCLFDAVNFVRISDFGLSRQASSYKMKVARKMPTKWLAPESLQSFMFYRASDVYTYGILLYEIYTCTEPYKNISGTIARKMICSGQFPSFEKEAPPELYDIVTKDIYLLDHTKRAAMKEIKKKLEDWLGVYQVINDEEAPFVEQDTPQAVGKMESKRRLKKSSRDESNEEPDKTRMTATQKDSVRVSVDDKPKPKKKVKKSKKAKVEKESVGTVKEEEKVGSGKDDEKTKDVIGRSPDQKTIEKDEKEDRIKTGTKDDSIDKEKEKPKGNSSSEQKVPDVEKKPTLSPTTGNNASDRKAKVRKNIAQDSLGSSDRNKKSIKDVSPSMFEVESKNPAVRDNSGNEQAAANLTKKKPTPDERTEGVTEEGKNMLEEWEKESKR